MNFGGIQKTSAIDYPGKITCVLFTTGCNFRCPYCHNPELIFGGTPDPISTDEALHFLQSRIHFLDAVTVSGGEPTLNTDLGNFLEKVKALGLLIKLDTNGSNPAYLQQYIENNLLDYIAMDLKTLPERYTEYLGAPANIESALRESIHIIQNAGISYEFRTTCVRPFLSLHTVQDIGKIIEGAPLWVFQQCRTDNVLQPTFFKSSHRLFDTDELNQFKKAARNFVAKTFVR